jgi:hypothetical protein
MRRGKRQGGLERLWLRNKERRGKGKVQPDTRDRLRGNIYYSHTASHSL